VSALRSWEWTVTWRTRWPLPQIRKVPLAGRESNVVDVEANDLADAGTGIERYEGERPVPR